MYRLCPLKSKRCRFAELNNKLQLSCYLQAIAYGKPYVIKKMVKCPIQGGISKFN